MSPVVCCYTTSWKLMLLLSHLNCYNWQISCEISPDTSWMSNNNQWDMAMSQLYCAAILFFGPMWFSDSMLHKYSIRAKWIFKIWLIQHASALGLVGVTSKIFSMRNAGVNGEWKVPKCRSNNNNRFIQPTRQTPSCSVVNLLFHPIRLRLYGLSI